MANKAERGTKRTCQNTACGARFYDLNREPIMCPVCSSVYSLPVGAPGAVMAAEAARRARKPELVEAAAGETPEVEADEALVDVDAGDEEIVAGEEETFLEQEEDEGGDVSGIIGGGSAEGEEET
jgi:uncharacterized protein (TIGR02300 family)